MMRVLWIIALTLLLRPLKAQELFPLNEPASSVPKGVWGLRAYGEVFHEIETYRTLGAVKLMYGLTPYWSLAATASVSNHHGEYLPADFITHTHSGNQTISYTQNIQKGIHYPFRYNGIHLYSKYRFLSIDDRHRHFRMAAYAEWSNVNQAHDEAEPNLTDDTRGAGGGLIATYLKNHLAVSLTTGFIIPGRYEETVEGEGNDPDMHTSIQYGNAFKYNLSLGYLLYPRHYTDYSQTNWNVYLEFMGKQYGGATVVQNGEEIPSQSFALEPGYYVEVYPGIQRIFNSNFRVDLCMGFNLVKKSYVRFYPVYMIGVQRYFYGKKQVKAAPGKSGS